MAKDREAILLWSFLAVILCGLLVVWVARSHFEAKSYNRITGESVTTWDAMFVNLRVQSEASPQSTRQRDVSRDGAKNDTR